MKIIDKTDRGTYRKDVLVQGETYRDTYGNYVLMTDEDKVVSLEDGVILNLHDEYSENDPFTPINAHLVVE
jgi:hypothetical protein